jgi:alpha-mannosidase
MTDPYNRQEPPMLDATSIRERVLRYLEQRIGPASVTTRASVEIAAWTTPGEPVPFELALVQTYTPVEKGERWGAPWSTTWFRIRGMSPGKPNPASELLVDLGFIDAQVGFQAEGLAYGATGTVIKAVNPRSRWVPLAGVTAVDGRFEVFVEAAANPSVLAHGVGLFEFTPTRLGDILTAGSEPLYSLGEISVVQTDRETVELAHDLRVLLELEGELPSASGRRWAILQSLERALDRLDVSDIPATAVQARGELVEALQSPAEASSHQVSAIGHAHIDSAWLWPFRETRRKVARTVANVLELLDEDPELIYAMSSAQQYAWLKEDHPQLFERVRERVAEGRFIPVGGMWVEADTNMPSGEALVRQFLQGSAFFDDEFGIASPSIAWLPDSFGYSAALPQIVRGVGARRFLTQKISWNTTNRFPHHTFWWEGIDGSRVFTHFPSADTYNSHLSGAEVAHAARNFSDKGTTDRSLIPFGFGDGGGGPTREMMASARRLRDLEGSPRVTIESPDAFFEKAELEHPDAAVWSGELYLEFHRGALTSQAETKRGNRRCESLFRQAELWSAQAEVREHAAYPYSELRDLWRRFLLLQFHDVLPGTSIAWVHREAERAFADIESELLGLIDRALAVLAVDGADHDLLFVNSSPYERRGVPAHSIGTEVPAQFPARVTVDANSGGVVLENGNLTALVLPDGTVGSLMHIATGREIVPIDERLNVLELHSDTPNRWDAWDIDESYRNAQKQWDSFTDFRWGVDQGSAWASVSRQRGTTIVTQKTILKAGSPALSFETTVDWNERETLLKAAFPLAVAAERWAAETQFGHVFRPTTANTSWETSKFEACAHRWIHVSEPDFGVALINEATYGHEVRRRGSVHGDVTTLARLSLLRSPNFPDPDADRGRHTLRYAIAPGAGIADAVRLGYAMGDEPRARDGVPVPALIRSSHPAVVVDTVKLAEDLSGDVIVRLYESHGTRVRSSLIFGFPFSAVEVVDLLERPIVVPADMTGSPELLFGPFEIRTIRLRRS